MWVRCVFIHTAYSYIVFLTGFLVVPQLRYKMRMRLFYARGDVFLSGMTRVEKALWVWEMRCF